jgi:hypothetical protein
VVEKMRVFRFLVLALFVSCNSQNNNKEVQLDSLQQKSFNDSIVNQFELFKRQLDSVQTFDSITLEQKNNLLLRCDSFAKRQLDYNDVLLRAEYYSYEANYIRKQIKVIVRKSDSIVRNNEVLKLEKQQIAEAMEYERKQKNIAIHKQNELQSKLDKGSATFVTNLLANGVGYSSSLFGKAKEYDTNKSSKVKKVRISFVFPYNPIAKKEVKNITAVVYSESKRDFISKDTSIYYDGIEQRIAIGMQTKDVKKGSHLIDVLINGKLQAQTNLAIQ